LPEPAGVKLTLEQRATRNRRDKRDLVEKGCSRGILVYSGRKPVGWCQYGPKKELPRIDAGMKYRRLDIGADEDLWRVTCFCVDRKFRNRKVASVALAAALGSVRRRGGRKVEACPVTRKGALAVWFGTVSMFENQGFEVVAPFGKSNVVMRRTF
jgi:GNAT superfamily N-acetyltransferase